MNKDIKYNGYSAVPSDYECQDGALAVSINLIPEDGGLKPILPPCKDGAVNDATCIYIHKNSGYTHYIVRNENTFGWCNKGGTVVRQSWDITGYIKVTSVGNTLVFLTKDGMRYYLWKADNSTYTYLGERIPECPITFGLVGEAKYSGSFNITFNPINVNDILKEPVEENKRKITEQVLAKVNKFIADESTNKGKFIFPFFVRYAYRLYDGTLTMHSSPVLMIASSGITPIVFCESLSGANNAYNAAICNVAAPVHTMDYAVNSAASLDILKEWSDIVRSVDVFISKPIYTYDQNGLCTRFAEVTESDSYCVCKKNGILSYLKDDYKPITFLDFFGYGYNRKIIIPSNTDSAIKEEIRSTFLFYFIRSINVDNLSTVRTAINIEENYLQSLTSREVMTDDYDSHDTIIPNNCFTYNSRLNLSGVSKRIYNEYHAGAMVTYTGRDILSDTEVYASRIYFYIKQDGKNIVVEGKASDMLFTLYPFVYIYYPNVNAYKAVISLRDWASPSRYEVALEPHGHLNGAFYFNGWEPPSSIFYENVAASSLKNRTIELPNKIYTSEVNNPFVFPVLGINTVGTGEIKGICSAVKALSEGQFGQFPLYAFTTEGVWALEVSSTGSYSARQPVTRDVCINADGITQLDSAVLFPTDRGIMLISGSQTICISEAINSEFPFNALSLPGFRKLHDMLRHNPDTDKCLPTLPFTEFLKQCKMIYDYVHQRVIVYAPGITYAYVYSLKSRQWGMIFSDIASHLNSYPEALAVDNDNNIVNFSEPVVESVNCLYVSRPLKLDASDILKTIDTIIQRGNFMKNHVSTVLYGSRDLINWHLVWSSKDHYLRGFRGTSYKYFRIAGVANLDPQENIVGASIQFTPKQTNQPR